MHQLLHIALCAPNSPANPLVVVIDAPGDADRRQGFLLALDLALQLVQGQKDVVWRAGPGSSDTEGPEVLVAIRPNSVGLPKSQVARPTASRRLPRNLRAGGLVRWSARRLSIGVVCVAGSLLGHSVRATPAAHGLQAPSSLTALLQRTAAYLEAYQKRLATVIAQEDYTLRGPAADDVARELTSDILLVGTDGSWVEFRDVFKVNKRDVRDHDARLEALLSNPTDVLTRAQKIADESARYNGSAVSRNINVPTMALTYLTRANQPRSSFERLGTDGDNAIIGFRETARPPLIHTSFGTAATSGRFWIDQVSGAVSKSELKVIIAQQAAINQDMAVSGTITVSYERDPALKFLVPHEMSEAYTKPTKVSGHATYSHYKAFGVVVATSLGRGGG